LFVDYCRERSNKAYDTLSYFTAKYFVELPINIVPSLIFAIIVFWIVGLNPRTFGYFLLIVMFTALTAISLGIEYRITNLSSLSLTLRHLWVRKKIRNRP
jgi:ABC-type multidrug transport system permease subunit